MDIIHLLPDSVANQIAAGEVIQRPASCLKELVENSIDAGATTIQIIVRDAGRTLLQVIDNGSGMSATDCRMAFERHATSKIRQAQDLFSLRTMGFRGEALASICAVAQVEVQTRRAEDEVGTLLEIAGSDVVRQEPCSCPVGTNFKVKNLFYNIPVRRKFLKTDQTELRNLMTEFQHIVLVYPKIQFTFVSNDEVIWDLPISTEKQRIEAIYGKGISKSYTSHLVDVSNDTELVSIRGFIGKPELATKNAQQYFFVNGRYMRHPYFHKAIVTAYSGMLQGDYAPSYFIYFDIDPQLIDVNIHPTKTEIKFQDEQTIFQILLASVRESLGKFNVVPSIDFDRQGEMEMPTTHSETTESPKVLFDPNYNPFKPSTSPTSAYTPTYTRPSYERVSANDIGAQMDLFDAHRQSDVSPTSLFQKYLMIPNEKGVLLIHQHRAHVRVLYDQYMHQFAEHKGVSQQLLFPEVLEFTNEEMTLVETLIDHLRYMGFELEQFSKNSYNMVGIPALLSPEKAVQSIKNILHTVQETGMDMREQWHQLIAMTLAEDTAIPVHKQLREEEAKDLIDRLLKSDSSRITPQGKTIICELTEDQIDKHF